MTPERQHLVSELCHRALQRPQDERDQFLREACGQDHELREEIAALLRYESRANTFLESRAVPLPSGSPAMVRVSRIDWLARHPFRIIVLVVSLVPLAAAIVTARAIWRYGAEEQFVGWAITWEPGVVGEVTAGGPADGKLLVGDRIVAMNGDERVRELGSLWKRRSLEAGSPYSVDIERNGERRRIELELQLRPTEWQPVLALRLLAAITWAVFALFIGLARPDMVAARLLSLTGLSMAVAIMRSVMFPLMPLMDAPSARFYGFLMLNTALPSVLAFHGLSRFPPGTQPGRVWSAALVAAYIATGVIVLQSVAMGVKYFAGADVALAVTRAVQRIVSTDTIGTMFQHTSIAVITALALAVALRNYRALREPEARRRLRWILAAVAVAAVAVIVNTATVSRFDLAKDAITELLSTVVPITFAYAIVKHRVFDIAVAVRLSVQYLLARSALRALIALPLVAMLVLLATNPNVTVRQVVFEHPAYPLLAIAAGIILALRQRLADAVDRRFFREAHDRERLLESIFEDIEALERTEDGAAQVAERLAAALHPTYVAIWFRTADGQSLRLSHSIGAQNAPGDDVWQVPSSFIHELEHSTDARRLESMWPAGDLGTLPQFVPTGTPGVLIPVIGRDGRLRGVLLLGAKRSEEAYTPADFRMLRRIARQIGVVREHAELRTRVGEEQRVRAEVLNKLGSSQSFLLKECPRCGACYDGIQDRCDADGIELTLTLPIERVVLGRYRLDCLIGRGGMGAVYEASDLRLQRTVAVKILLGRHFGDERALRRFDREARAVARLSHPNIIAVFDYGPLDPDGAFLVMERVHGQTMRAELAAGAAAPVRRRAWIEQMLDGVAAAHAHGVIHRDLKPENVLVSTTTGADVIKLLDFGLAKLRLDSSDATISITAAGHVIGTLSYMAPEQLLGRSVDERTDIFALGVIVFEIMSGWRPFPDDPLARLAHVRGGLPPLPAASTDIQRVLIKCTAADPGERYDTVAALRDDLLPLLA